MNTFKKVFRKPRMSDELGENRLDRVAFSPSTSYVNRNKSSGEIGTTKGSYIQTTNYKHLSSSTGNFPNTFSSTTSKSTPSLPIRGHVNDHEDFSAWVPYQNVDKTKTSAPTLADKYVQKAIQCHERNELEKAAHFFRLAACQGSPVGLFLYGISLRHGWGCKANPQVAFQCLQKAAECAVFDLNNLTNNTNLSAAKYELVLAIYELGVCFQHGWGVPKNKATAAYYFEIAANLGDPDAQNDLAFCYLHGHGVKKDRFKAAKYYRMAHAQGMGVVGNSWIFKEKYDNTL